MEQTSTSAVPKVEVRDRLRDKLRKRRTVVQPQSQPLAGRPGLMSFNGPSLGSTEFLAVASLVVGDFVASLFGSLPGAITSWLLLIGTQIWPQSRVTTKSSTRTDILVYSAAYLTTQTQLYFLAPIIVFLQAVLDPRRSSESPYTWLVTVTIVAGPLWSLNSWLSFISVAFGLGGVTVEIVRFVMSEWNRDTPDIYPQALYAVCLTAMVADYLGTLSYILARQAVIATVLISLTSKVVSWDSVPWWHILLCMAYVLLGHWTLLLLVIGVPLYYGLYDKVRQGVALATNMMPMLMNLV